MTNNNMNNDDIGLVVWSKFKKFPWWPSKIYDLVLKQKPKSTKSVYVPVLFYATNNYGWITRDCMKPFLENMDSYKNKKKTKQFIKAIDEAKSELDKHNKLNDIVINEEINKLLLTTTTDKMKEGKINQKQKKHKLNKAKEEGHNNIKERRTRASRLGNHLTKSDKPNKKNLVKEPISEPTEKDDDKINEKELSEQSIGESVVEDDKPKTHKNSKREPSKIALANNETKTSEDLPEPINKKETAVQSEAQDAFANPENNTKARETQEQINQKETKHREIYNELLDIRNKLQRQVHNEMNEHGEINNLLKTLELSDEFTPEDIEETKIVQVIEWAISKDIPNDGYKLKDRFTKLYNKYMHCLKSKTSGASPEQTDNHALNDEEKSLTNTRKRKINNNVNTINNNKQNNQYQ